MRTAFPSHRQESFQAVIDILALGDATARHTEEPAQGEEHEKTSIYPGRAH